MRPVSALAVLAQILMIAACTSSPVTVTRVDARDVHRRLTQSALSAGQLSTFTRNVLLEADLAALYRDDPETALERLHDLAVSGSGGPNELFAAAEASFLHAERTRQLPYYLVATLSRGRICFPKIRSRRRALLIRASGSPPTSTTAASPRRSSPSRVASSRCARARTSCRSGASCTSCSTPRSFTGAGDR